MPMEEVMPGRPPTITPPDYSGNHQDKGQRLKNITQSEEYILYHSLSPLYQNRLNLGSGTWNATLNIR